MLTLGITLLVVGAVIGVGTFIFATVNMGRAFKDPFSMLGMGETSGKQKSGFGGFFGGHISAMIAMALCGLVSFVGIVLIIISLAQEYIG